MADSSSSEEQTIQQHPVNEVQSNNYRMSEENISPHNDNLTYHQFSNAATTSIQFYQQVDKNSSTLEQSNEEQQQQQHQKSQQMYETTTYSSGGSDQQQSPTSSNFSYSPLINSTSSSAGSKHLFQDQNGYHRQQQQESSYQQLQMQPLSNQIDHQTTISSNDITQQSINEQYSNSRYNYKCQEEDACSPANHWNQISIESTNLDTSNQTYIHHQHHLHKTLSSDNQDFNNNQEQDYQTTSTASDESSSFINQPIEQRQDNYTNRNNQNQEQLYTSASYSTNSTSDTYHDVCGNLENNLQQIEPLVQALPPFESINGTNRNHNQQVQYTPRSGVIYNQYGESEERINSYQHQQQPANNLKPSYEDTQYQLHYNQHQYWNNEQPMSQDNSLTNQHHTFIGTDHHHQQVNQYAHKPQQQLPYDSLQQLSMNCDSYTNQVSTTTTNAINGLDADGAFQATGKSRGLKGRRGRPRKKGLRSKNKVNGKLWEFIRDLLLSDRTNPSFIRWERREDGVFKFVQSDKVAKMWGERKQNPKMTYEKLSRAMRYYYKSKVLLPVFGRRLVYKFGPNATGWLPSPNDTVF